MKRPHFLAPKLGGSQLQKLAMGINKENLELLGVANTQSDEKHKELSASVGNGIEISQKRMNKCV